jgi:thiol-disulfide isomerase/thioredoxin
MAFAVLFGVGGCAHDAPAPAAPHASAARPKKAFEGALPDIEVEALDGHARSLREVTKGKVAVVDLWATWCTSCREVSARAAELAKANDDPDLMVVGVAEGEERDTISRFLGGPLPRTRCTSIISWISPIRSAPRRSPPSCSSIARERCAPS